MEPVQLAEHGEVAIKSFTGAVWLSARGKEQRGNTLTLTREVPITATAILMRPMHRDIE